jgi:hypothetical protein
VALRNDVRELLPGNAEGDDERQVEEQFEWGGRGSNPRPMDYESTALTD